MDNISEITRSQLQSKKAWITAIALMPVTVLSCWFFTVLSDDGFLFKIPFWGGGAVIAFFAGVCLDQAAHIYCCYKGSKNSLIMRIFASTLELIGVAWFTVWMCVGLFELLLMFFPVTLLLLFICLWKVLEILSLIRCMECLTDMQTTGVLGFFGAVGIILGLIFLLITFFLWAQFAEYYDLHTTPSAIPEVISYGLLFLGFSFIPVYMIALSLHMLSVKDALREGLSEQRFSC